MPHLLHARRGFQRTAAGAFGFALLSTLTACGSGESTDATASNAAASATGMSSPTTTAPASPEASASATAPAHTLAPTPSGWSFIANEYEKFSVSRTRTVRYGLDETWVQRNVSGSGSCTNDFFGSDPVFSKVKRCEVQSEPTPTPSLPTLASNKAWFAASKYGLMIHYVPRGGTDPIVAGADGTWKRTVNGFDVARFVSDVQKTGAAYVMFSIGQNAGYYVSPNSVFTQKTGTQVGQYVSERDLIDALSGPLKAAGIKLFVYATADGPTAAPQAIRATFPVPNDQASPEARATLNAMHEQWSTTWGDKVSGWWIDGCYPGLAGYANTVDGEANVDALLRAARKGNPAALVTCNPSVQMFNGVSSEQDFMAGEENTIHRYPTPGLVTQFKGKDQVWHVMTYLGADWGQGPEARFGGDQLAAYIKHVSDRAGVVTMDVGVRADGTLFAPQVAALAQVKAVVRDGQVLARSANLARYKPVRLLSNTTDRDLPFNGAVYAHFGMYAVDGVRNDLSAQGSVEWAWSLSVDLLAPTTIGRVVVTFDAVNFATNFTIEVSDDERTWRAVANKAATAAGTHTLSFPLLSARYVRIKANTPNGERQLGGQMAVSEFEVFAN